MTDDREPTRLVLVIHNHQPVGNFDSVLEQAVDRSYGPFVDLLAEHPRVRLGLHFTGCLLEWIESHRPSVISTVRELCEKGQVEILGGGWAEPMLAVLSDRDAIGQIRMMRAECARLFGVVPRGMWLAERVWTPDLPRILAAAEVGYTLLDDTHFRHAGLLDPRLTGHYVTEKAGDAVAVFPIDRELRYAIPFQSPDEAIAAITSAGPGATLTYGDDGEKFGVWPGTHEWVWEKGWLASFFDALEKEEGRVQLVLPSEQLAERPPAGRVYLPTASYHEMGEWTLGAGAGRRLLDLKAELKERSLADEAEPFLHGGIWMGFLAKYAESNLLHKRMVRVSGKVSRAGLEGESVLEARRALYRGQCNCPYWHGLFGGLYLPHIRHAVFGQLVAAEALVDPTEGILVDRADLDGDLEDEVALEGPGLVAWIDPGQGGQAVVLDDRRRQVALGHVLTRRPETYHRELLWAAEEGTSGDEHDEEDDGPRSIHDIPKPSIPGLRDRLVYDPYDRRILVDHLLPADADPSAIEGPAYEPLADLARLSYRIDDVSSEESKGTLVLGGEAPLLGRAGRLLVRKTIELRAAATLEVSYELSLEAEEPLEATFAVESSLALVPGDRERFFVRAVEPAVDGGDASPEEPFRWPPVRLVSIGSALGPVTATLAAEPAAPLWAFPIQTVSQSEGGAELVYQGTVVTAAWPVTLEPGEPLRRGLTLVLE